MSDKLKTILGLSFFGVYALLMLYEGVFKELSSISDWKWILFFVLGAIVTYWAHQKSGIITIALLFLHTTLEMIHHGAEYQTLTVVAGIVLLIHFLFDCGFLWSEMEHHAKSPIRTFVAILLFYIFAFGTSITLAGSDNQFIETIEGFGSAITGGIFACVLAHGIGMVKKLKKQK